MSLLALAMVGCSGGISTPSSHLTYFPIATPTPTPKPSPTAVPTRTPRPTPTWSVADQGHWCRAYVALGTASAEANDAVVDADAGRWVQTLAHADQVELQGQLIMDELDSVSSPFDDQVAYYRDAGEEYRDNGHEVAWAIRNEGERDSFHVRILRIVGLSPPLAAGC